MNRHPKACKFYQNFGRCKFSPCAYYHDNRLSLQGMKIETLDRKFEAQDVQINEFKKNLALLTDSLNSLTAEIVVLKEKCVTSETPPGVSRAGNKLDEDVPNIDVTDEKFQQMEARIQKVHDDNYVLIHAVDDLEKAVKAIQLNFTKQAPLLGCTACGNMFTNEPAWRNHMRNHHGRN